MDKKLFALAAFAILLAGCNADNQTADETPTEPAQNISIKTETMTTKKENPAKNEEKTPKNVVLHTNKGDITIKVLADSAPQTVESFWKLSRDGKYDDVPFHRVIENFMIQTGDYTNKNGTGGQSWFGEEMKNEIDMNLSHKKGMVSMANRGPNTNGSQFFIVHKDAPHLDGSYSIFGEIIKGMDVVDEIAMVETGAADKPLSDILIEKTSLEY